MRVVAGEDNYNAQKDFVGRLCSLARDHNIHIHLVHHVRKLEDEKKMPGKFDSKGSGAITDQVDQVLTVWRNKEKQKTIEQFTFDKKLLTPEIENKPDSILACDKNRHGSDPSSRTGPTDSLNKIKINTNSAQGLRN